jgi:hypothetical protein
VLPPVALDPVHENRVTVRLKSQERDTTPGEPSPWRADMAAWRARRIGPMLEQKRGQKTFATADAVHHKFATVAWSAWHKGERHEGHLDCAQQEECLNV